MAEILNCEKRDFTGTLRNRRMRQAGKTPAVLYGRGENINLSIETRDISAAIRHGSRIVELKGGCNESALIKEVQWCAFGVDVMHLDLTRIDANEAVELTLKVNLVGDAPGTKAGGTIKQLLHSVDVKCPATAVPEKLELKINDLDLNGDLKASDIVLPEGATLVTEEDSVIVQCVEVAAVEESAEADSDAPAEPEVIGRKADDEEDND
ncbi:MAG: 50S ribosomal protein L25 [Planctomycetota bacterium]